MKRRLWLLRIGLLLLVAWAPAVRAEEQYLNFLQGLRDRNYFDYAILYLDQLAARASLPEEIRQSLPYEKAVTLRENAKVLRSPEKQSEQLDQALALLEQFSRDNPLHPYSADANSDRAQILLQKAEVEITQSKSPINKGSKGEFQRRGRALVVRAKQILTQAFDQHDMALKKFPAYIDEQKEPKLHAERAKVERSLILEALNLAKCTYYEAQTYDGNSREFRQLLTQAADEFEKVHQKYRSQLGGLNARAWQGKCFEEQGEYQKALGIYNELLEHPGDDPSLRNLKAQTLLFKLICLHAQQQDQLVVDLAEEWLKKNVADSKSQIGLGIQWEEARAFEALGDDRSLQKADQERFWRQARTTAQQINRFPGEYKDVSLSMMQRMQVKLGGRDKKADDFETAYGLGRQSFNAAQELKKEMDAGARSLAPEELSRLRQNWISELNEAARNLDLASNLVTKKDNPKEVGTSRLLRAYTCFYLRRNYEAAILAQFVARTTNDDEDGVALDAAYMAMAAFVQAYNDSRAEPDQKVDDMRLITKAADLITSRWPDSEKSNEARMVLGRLFTAAKKPADAAEWFSKIPESDPMFPEAQLAAGQAYWLAYGAAGRLPADARPSPEKLEEWKTVSEKFLNNGIAKLTATLTDDTPIPQELVSAKIYLAEIYLSQGKEVEASKLLLDDPQSVVKAIAIEDESLRPEKGIQSRPVAKSVYTLLLRADIGMGLDKLNDARATMKKLEAIAAGDSTSDLTDLYVGLGRMLKTELERFRSNGEINRFKKLMTAFESFLGDMFKKQDGQTPGSLSWIGETYFALGEISTDKSKAASYYDRAATAFNSILTKAENDPNFATPEQLLNVKVRVVHCNRLKKDFPEAEKLLAEVLKARGNDLRTQIEGASLYQDWGLDGDNKKFAVAITGNKAIGLWGWGGIANLIKRQKDFVERPELVDTFLDANYGVTFCRFHFGKDQGPKERQKIFDKCAGELIGSSAIMKPMPEEKWARFNSLYREVLRESGKPIVDLPHSDEPSRPAPSSENDKPDSDLEPTKPLEQPVPAPAAQTPVSPPANEGDLSTWIMILGSVVASVVVAGWVVMTGKRTRPKPKVKKKPIGPSATPDLFTGIAIEKPSASDFSVPTATARPRPKTSTGTAAPAAGSSTASGSPPRSRSDTGATSAPKPRPRPPSPPSER